MQPARRARREGRHPFDSPQARRHDAPPLAHLISATAARCVAEDALAAGGAAALISGAPSTIIALWRGEDPLEASLAAGSLILAREQRPIRLLAAAALVHATLSLGWALLLTIALPQRATIWWSTIAGLAIAGLDLGIVSRRFERVRALPKLPQVADHIAYGLTIGAVVAARRKHRK
jgi:hypothetical protein